MYDIAMEKISKEIPYKPAYEQDFRRLLDNQSIDAIAVATPDHWHALQTVKALEAGKHVFVEKPASFNINDGKAMVAAQKKHPDLVVAVGTQQRSAAHFKDAKAFIDEGHLGQISFARAWLSGGRHRVEKVPNTEPPKHLDYDMWVGPAPKRPYNPEKLHYNWHFMRDYGTNDAGNWGAHWLDIVRWYADLDVPLAASSVGGKYVIHDEKEWFDTQTTLFEFPNLTVVWEMRHWTNTGVEGMGIGTELRGSKGTLLIDRGGWRFYPKGGEMVKHGGSVTDKPHTTNFADCIAGDAKPAASIEDGHKTAIMCHLANITTSFNRHVKFDPRTQTIVDDPQASAMEGREYRSQWQMPESVARAIS
jgi:predicted dehydrogenase